MISASHVPDTVQMVPHGGGDGFADLPVIMVGLLDFARDAAEDSM